MDFTRVCMRIKGKKCSYLHWLQIGFFFFFFFQISFSSLPYCWHSLEIPQILKHCQYSCLPMGIWWLPYEGHSASIVQPVLRRLILYGMTGLTKLLNTQPQINPHPFPTQFTNLSWSLTDVTDYQASPPQSEKRQMNTKGCQKDYQTDFTLGQTDLVWPLSFDFCLAQIFHQMGHTCRWRLVKALKDTHFCSCIGKISDPAHYL